MLVNCCVLVSALLTRIVTIEEEVPAAAAEGDMVMNQGEDDDVMQSSMIVSNGLP
jgi:hypothetical protein